MARKTTGFVGKAKIHDQTLQRGEGGELIQHANSSTRLLTTAHGVPLAVDQNSAALTFELSKVKIPAIRERMVSHLLNIEEGLANRVAPLLGIKKMPKPADAAIATRQDLAPSPALSIVERGPNSFKGRQLGIVVTDGTDAEVLISLQAALAKKGAVCEIIAPKVGDVEASDGSWIEADQMIDGGPSVLYDAVALLPSAAGIDDLLAESTARNFVADAFAHRRFIGYAEAATPFFAKAGIYDSLDKGVIALNGPNDIAAFVDQLGQFRLWCREPSVKAR